MPKVSKKKVAKAKSARVSKAQAAPKGRGGRKPGTWTLVQPEQILAYRQEHRLSRATFAAMVGVSSTTVQNWELGKGAAFQKAQEKIATVIGSAPAVTTSKQGARPTAIATNGQHPAGYDSVVEGTAKIVAAFLTTAKIGRGELGAVVREVRAALR